MAFLGLGEDTKCESLKPLYRLYMGDEHKDHFLTTNVGERDYAAANLTYQIEQSPMAYCTEKPACGASVPLFRFWNGPAKDHFYTTESKESDQLTQANGDWKYEKIECYLWPSSNGKAKC